MWISVSARVKRFRKYVTESSDEGMAPPSHERLKK